MAQPAVALDDTEPSRSKQPLQSRSAKRIALRVAADAVAVSSALFIASILRFEVLNTSPATSVDYTLVTLIATPVHVLLF